VLDVLGRGRMVERLLATHKQAVRKHLLGHRGAAPLHVVDVAERIVLRQVPRCQLEGVLRDRGPAPDHRVGVGTAGKPVVHFVD
jgi:hypothetical protein